MGDVRTWLVVNTASGGNDEVRQAQLVDALAAAGARPDRVINALTAECPTGAALDEAGAELLVIFAGDGTINSVLLSLGEWRGRVLVLPGGTANLLAHALHGDRDELEIIAILPDLVPVRRHAVRCDHGIALIELLAGPGAVWSDVRESLREGAIGEVVSGGIEAAQQSLVGPTVVIAEPKLGEEGGYAGIRISPRSEGLEIEGYGAQSFGDLLKQGVALLRRDYRKGPHDALGFEVEIVCASSGEEPIELMIDGERRTGGRQERISLVELPIDLLAAQA